MWTLINKMCTLFSDTPSYRANEDTCRSRAEERTNSCQQIGISGAIGNGKFYGIRYFIIKSLNHENIQLSVNRGIWATQVMNEPILDEAFNVSRFSYENLSYILQYRQIHMFFLGRIPAR